MRDSIKIGTAGALVTDDVTKLLLAKRRQVANEAGAAIDVLVGKRLLTGSGVWPEPYVEMTDVLDEPSGRTIGKVVFHSGAGTGPEDEPTAVLAYEGAIFSITVSGGIGSDVVLMTDGGGDIYLSTQNEGNVIAEGGLLASGPMSTGYWLTIADSADGVPTESGQECNLHFHHASHTVRATHNGETIVLGTFS